MTDHHRNGHPSEPRYHLVVNGIPELRSLYVSTIVAATEGGLRVVSASHDEPAGTASCAPNDLVKSVAFRARAAGVAELIGEPVRFSLYRNPGEVDRFATQVLALPSSERWREAVTTAVLGDWCDPLLRTGHLPSAALGKLRAETRAVHRQLVPLWRRGTRHGRLLSLDAGLGDGLSLYDLVVADIDGLARTVGEVFEDDRLNRVLRALDSDERAVVFAYAEGEGTTWTEAATAAGATDPAALGERVRRKAKRIAAEQARHAAQVREAAEPISPG
ncbi:hypothetical protein [Streptomyces chartreusis]|uniref:hypothetical protein n=1 Tax=Streptomyces chartreusis TaxID=1969 RepID=UPI0037950654